MTRPTRVIAGVLAAVVAVAPSVRAEGADMGVTVEPRIVEATIAGISLERLDVSLRVGLRASRGATIRSIAFTDAFVGRVPVWIDGVEGEWPLTAGQELVIPKPMQVRIHARDALGTDDFGAIIRKGSVSVRASVEVALATPWLARLFFAGPTRTLVRELVLDMPVQMGPAYLSPLTRIGAGLADAAQRGAASWLATGLNRLPARSAVVQRYGAAVATVVARYDVDGAAAPTMRERRAAGVWWSASVFCTTREAVEPWRFDVGDAIALQHGGAQVRRESGRISVGATPDHAAFDLTLAALDPLLPAPDERKLYALVDGQVRKLRLADRNAPTNLVCVRVGGADAAPLPTADTAAVAAGPSTEVAAFSPGPSLGVVWTSVAAADDERLTIVTPVHRTSFGSPLVATDRVVGLVASPTTAWPAALVAAAASRAPRLR